jgi:hypothetical protein
MDEGKSTEDLDRELIEFLNELRVALPGVQVLFAFLLMAPLNGRFQGLTGAQRTEYAISLLTTGAAVLLLITPTAYHRILFRCGDKEHLVTVANRLTLAALACVGLGMLSGLLLVLTLLLAGALPLVIVGAAALAMLWAWCVGPLLRRRHVTAPRAIQQLR